MRLWQTITQRFAAVRNAERRAARRMRSRLRPGKILRPDLGFLADCAIVDRSATGLRVRCFGPIENEGKRLSVLDEGEGTIRSARLVWRHGSQAGFRVEGEARPLDADDRRRLTGPYYAVTE